MATRAGFEILIDNRPRGDATVTEDRAWMRFGVTGLYRTWADGGPFPSQGRTIRRGTPLVVDVRPDSFASRTSRSASPRSTGTPTPRRSCAGRRRAIAEPPRNGLHPGNDGNIRPGVDGAERAR